MHWIDFYSILLGLLMTPAVGNVVFRLHLLGLAPVGPWKLVIVLATVANLVLMRMAGPLPAVLLTVWLDKLFLGGRGGTDPRAERLCNIVTYTILVLTSIGTSLLIIMLLNKLLS